MTIYCKICGETPFNYKEINGRNLCLKCAKKEYNLKLKELKNKYGI